MQKKAKLGALTGLVLTFLVLLVPIKTYGKTMRGMWFGMECHCPLIVSDCWCKIKP